MKTNVAGLLRCKRQSEIKTHFTVMPLFLRVEWHIRNRQQRLRNSYDSVKQVCASAEMAVRYAALCGVCACRKVHT